MVSKQNNPLQTVLLLAIAGTIFFLWKQWTWALYVGLAIGILGLLSSSVAQTIDWVWRKLGEILGWFVPKILLSLIFFLVLWPTARLARLFGQKDPLDLKDEKESMFHVVEKTYQAEDFEKPW
ncbi:MAG: hypothetical protein Sapg2KO_39570 [Saprospiraceae bacterium]